VTEIIHTAGKVLLVCVIVIGCFWLFKHRTRATIEQGDKSMDASIFPEGGYSVDTSIETIAGIKSGDFVAYRLPNDAAGVRIARVLGVEGNRVEVTQKSVMVNGAAIGGKFNTAQWTIPETKVPRGCAYVLADDTFAGVDSRTIGPVPFASILGTVKPSR
jgi:signal peptidase I